MPVRQSYQFNSPNGINKGGLILSHASDIKGFKNDNSSLPWMVDLNAQNLLQLGDTVAGGRSGIPLGVVPAGGFGVNQRTITGPITTSQIVDDCAIIIDSSAGAVTFNLIDASLCPGFILPIYRTSGANNINIVAFGAQTIDGQAILGIEIFRGTICLRSTGSNWLVIWKQSKCIPIFNDVNPTATNTGAISTISTLNTFLWGRPLHVTLSGSMQDSNGANEFMLVDFFIRFNGGADQRICQWSTNVVNDHKAFSGNGIYTPLIQGSQNIDLRWQRLGGAGTATIDVNDFIFMSAFEF